MSGTVRFVSITQVSVFPVVKQADLSAAGCF